MSMEGVTAPDEFKTIAGTGEGFYSEKRSKFLAFALHVESVAEVKDILQDYRKRYYDARHVCYAYVLGAERGELRANDDGEPGSTAGKPILGQINSLGLTDVLVVVVRYYGGVNLGTGGLIVAFRTAAAEALAAAEIVTRPVEDVVTSSFPHVLMDALMRVGTEMKTRRVSQDYGGTCEIRLAIRRSEAGKLRARLEKLSFE